MARSVTGPVLIGALVAAVTLVAVGPSSTIDAEVAGASPGSPRGAAAVIAAGDQHTCAVLRDGEVICWGRNDRGQLGRGDKIDVGDGNGPTVAGAGPIDLGPGRTAVQVATGRYHTCALLDDGDVMCWGANDHGQLGRGDTVDVGDGDGPDVADIDPVDLGPGRTATAVAAGTSHTCVLLRGGDVVCWGRGGAGRLGQNSSESIGNGVGPDVADIDPVDLGPGRTATAVTTGGAHTCVLLDDHSVRCWGDNELGAMGLGHNLTDVGDGVGPDVLDVDPVDLGEGAIVVAVAAGGAHNCVLLVGGDVKCWGSSNGGQLGQGSTGGIGDGPDEMGDNLPPIDLGDDRRAVSVTAGSTHSCALLDTGDVLCWGSNTLGQLGQGNSTGVGDGNGPDVAGIDPVDLGDGQASIAVVAGRQHTCGLLDNGYAKCWGRGLHGALGSDDTSNIGTSPLDMGNQLGPVETGVAPSRRINPVTASPAWPTGVSATAATRAATVSWAAPGDDGGAPVTGYRMQASTDGGTTWSTVLPDTGSSATTANVTGLTGGAPTRFRVAAFNAAGMGVWSLPSAPVTPYAAYLPLDPARLLDTRSPGGETIDGQFAAEGELAAGDTIELQVTGRGGVPTDAEAVALNITVNEPHGAGFITAHPCGTPRPNASNLNYVPGQTIPNNVIVRTGTGGTVCIYSDQTTNLIADVNGAFPS